jgi:hypothetical protein
MHQKAAENPAASVPHQQLQHLHQPPSQALAVHGRVQLQLVAVDHAAVLAQAVQLQLVIGQQVVLQLKPGGWGRAGWCSSNSCRNIMNML